MNRIFLLIIAVPILGINGSGETDKLVGARNADIGELPYQVSLRLNGKHFCGGALISKKHVLTAAHCVYAARKAFFVSLYAVVGTNSLGSGGDRYRISGLSQHPSYVDKKTPDWMFDIGVFTLGSEVELSERVGLVKLPKEDVTVGSEALVSGWGTMVSPLSPLSPNLQKLSLKIISHEKCQNMMPSFATVHTSHICTYVRRGAGSCSGDSGGPLVQDGIVIGVVSGGIPCAVGYPDVFTNVYTYLSYVKKIIEK